MPPRASRSKAATASATPAPQKPSAKGKKPVEPVAQEEIVEQEAAIEAEESAPTPAKGKGKGKGKAKASQEEEKPSPVPAPEAVEVDDAVKALDVNVDAGAGSDADGSHAAEAGSSGQQLAGGSAQPEPKLTIEERMAKLKELRLRKNQSTAQNRKDLIADDKKSRTTAQEIARLEKQRKLADVLREKIDADENGEDLDRKKAWGYTLEDQERWDERLERKKESGQFEFDDQDSNAQRKYIKSLKSLKPDMTAYNRQKEIALGLAPGTIVPISASSSSTHLVATGSRGASGSKALSAAENLYRDGKTLAYADNKPSDEAIDKVLGQMNKDLARAQKAQNKRNRVDDEGDVTYINEANKVFNKKVNRYFDKYTQEIRANFERGTAL